MTTQAMQATSLNTLERLLLQQTETLNQQFELVKSIASNKTSESSAATETTISTPSSMSKSKTFTDMEIATTSPHTTLKRSRRLSAVEPSDMTDATYHPELNNYTRKQRSVLFTFLDNKN